MRKPIYIATLHRPGDLIGGIQKHYITFAEEARRAGFSAKILTPFHVPKAIWFPLFGFGKVMTHINKPYHAWWYETTRLRLLQQALLAGIPRTTPTVIYAQDPVSTEAALQLKKQGYLTEVVSAVHFNVSIADEWVGKGYFNKDHVLYSKMLQRDANVLPQVDRLVFVSRFMQLQVEARLPELKSTPSSVVPNFVPAPTTTFQSDSIAADLITIGTLEPRKNQAFLLDVLYHAHQQGHPYRLNIVGDGPSRGKLQARTRTLGLEPYVRFFGALPRAAELLGQHRVYVHAAHMENLPVVLIEALAASLPLFAAPVGGITEIYDDGTEGYYWSLENPAGAAEKLIKVLENEELYRQMSRAAQTRHVTQFSPDAVQEKLLQTVLGESTSFPLLRTP